MFFGYHICKSEFSKDFYFYFFKKNILENNSVNTQKTLWTESEETNQARIYIKFFCLALQNIVLLKNMDIIIVLNFYFIAYIYSIKLDW